MVCIVHLRRDRLAHLLLAIGRLEYFDTESGVRLVICVAVQSLMLSIMSRLSHSYRDQMVSVDLSCTGPIVIRRPCASWF